ncbi:MAG: cysteine desulfurase-like protein [Acidimicrobiia bacterium]|nr:cysteine desulfurase-like protein [Acidimicrobiia bacterium]
MPAPRALTQGSHVRSATSPAQTSALYAGGMVDAMELRKRFPALERMVGDHRALYLDGPAGTQVPQSVIDAVANAMVESVSNVGGGFDASRDSDRVVADAREAGADFFDAQPDEIVFGANMTTITFAFSRAVSATWKKGDAIVVSGLDHDANVTPWVRAAQERDVEVRFVEIHEDATLDHSSLEGVLDESVRLVAVTGCSNTFGTMVDVPAVVAAAHADGARVYVDAVHRAPHVRPVATSLGADAIISSAYKFHGPHLGVMRGNPEWLEEIEAVKVRPAPTEVPGRFETGSLPFPLLAGFSASIDHLASLGDPDGTRRERLTTGYDWIRDREDMLGQLFLDTLPDNVAIIGPPTMDGRVSTFAVSVQDVAPDVVARMLADVGIFVWAGHNYAVEPIRRLGYLDTGGLVRIGITHLNTEDEITRLNTVLERIKP